ncbi:MAG: hypothetical protein ACREHD_01705 [Pirellulales bacterium]
MVSLDQNLGPPVGSMLQDTLVLTSDEASAPNKTKGGKPNPTRFDPYKNYKFRL